MTTQRKTSSKMAKIASKTLLSKNTTSTAKKLAGSVLSQVAPKKKK